METESFLSQLWNHEILFRGIALLLSKLCMSSAEFFARHISTPLLGSARPKKEKKEEKKDVQ